MELRTINTFLHIAELHSFSRAARELGYSQSAVSVQIRQLEQNRLDTERKLNMQITSYQTNMAASSEQVVSNRENVMQAQKAVQIAGKRYEVGKGTVLELNTSQVQLTEAELTYNQSIYDYLVAKADLDQVLGKDYIAENEE